MFVEVYTFHCAKCAIILKGAVLPHATLHYTTIFQITFIKRLRCHYKLIKLQEKLRQQIYYFDVNTCQVIGHTIYPNEACVMCKFQVYPHSICLPVLEEFTIVMRKMNGCRVVLYTVHVC